jgi:CubicO group peptidase (beta-lactamase class C family)
MLIRIFSSLLVISVLISCNSNRLKNQEVESEKVSCEFCVDSSDFKRVSKKLIKSIRPKIAAYYKYNFESVGFNGSFLVAKNGRIIYEKYSGYSSYKNKSMIKASTPMHLASVGKVLTATAIFRLVELNKLKLDQKVSSVLPSFPYEDISIRMLLNHRSGVPKYANFAEPDSIWGVEKTLHNQDILNLLAKHKFPLDFVPDTKFVYNNSNFAILALVVEKIYGKSFKESMEELVFEPLGMTNSFVFILEEDKYKVSQSYSSRMERQKFDNLDAIYGDKNIYSTPRDLLKFDLAMQKNDFISKKLKKEIYKGYSYERAGINNYGLGIRVKEWDSGQKLFFHNGWWHGSRSSYVTMKEEGVTIIALTNANTRKVYAISQLSALFGDYPFGISEEEEGEVAITSPDAIDWNKKTSDTIKPKVEDLKTPVFRKL